MYKVSPLKENDIRKLVNLVIQQEAVNIAPEAVDSLVKLAKGDMRRALNVLQACHAGSRPLPIRGQTPLKDSEINFELITNDTIYTCVAAPHPSDIKLIMNTLLSTPDVTSCLTTINSLKTSRGLALADILTALAEELQKLEVSQATRVTWLEGLAEIEFRLSGGGSEGVQTGGMVGIVRTGIELMGEKGMKA
jgi:replication factor C subunit 3/5